MIIDANFIAKWDDKRHQLGTAYLSPCDRFMYINIPKNASSSTKTKLPSWVLTNYYTVNTTGKTFIVVLRDPIDRWLSGIAEYFSLYHANFNTWNKDVFDLVFDRVAFDCHTDRQVNFLHRLDADQCVFFNANDDYTNTVSRYLEQHSAAHTSAEFPRQNVTVKGSFKRHVKDLFAHEVATNTARVAQLTNYFAQDYELISTVAFQK